jgi:IS30 family transposase
MANHLKMAQTQSIKALLLRGWSRRRIARELGVDRGTVGKIAQRLLADESAQPPPPPDPVNAG